MDYGSYLKKQYPNPSRKSRHHTVQAKFTGSNREVRGHILRLLMQKPKQPKQKLLAQLPYDQPRITTSLEQLASEGFLAHDAQNIWLI